MLRGKVAIITGGVTGIGKAIALKMNAEGARVCVNHLDTIEQHELARSLSDIIGDSSFLAVPGDISLPETSSRIVRETVQKFGEVNILVSNAGICGFFDFFEIEPEVFQRTVETNLNGSFYIIQEVGRQMKSQGKGGSIVAISSISALVGGREQAHYTPTKAGISSLIQSAACALGPFGIRCNALLPGTIKTSLNEEDLKDRAKKEYMEGRIPLGRLGVPDDLAGPAVFLASDLSLYMNGSQLLVDGGLFVNLQ